MIEIIAYLVLAFWMAFTSTLLFACWRRQQQNDEAIARLSVALLDHKTHDHGDAP